MVASSEPMYGSIRLKLVSVSSGAPRLIDAVQYGVTDPSNSADSIGFNKKQIVAILYQLAMAWVKSATGLNVTMQSSSRTITRINKVKCWASHRELLQQAKGKRKLFITCHLATPGASVSLFQGAILHKWQLVQRIRDYYIHYYCVYTVKLTLASQVLLNSCAQIRNIWDPEYQKNYFYRTVKSYPNGILSLPTTSDTP